MRIVRQILTFMVSGSLLGVLLSSFVGPRYIEFGATPGWGETGAHCFCAETARQGAEMLVSFQMKGILVGAVVGLLAGVAFVIVRRRQQAAAPPTV